jgi:DNA modification methylase
VWEVSRDNGHGKATTTYHPTQKPVELARRAIVNSTQEGEIVLDMFAGSSSTIMGAEQTRRCGYAIELDPRYVDQGVRRWQELTGKQATHATEKKTFDALAKSRAGRQAGG